MCPFYNVDLQSTCCVCVCVCVCACVCAFVCVRERERERERERWLVCMRTECSTCTQTPHYGLQFISN